MEKLVVATGSHHTETPLLQMTTPPNPTRADFWVPIKVGHNKPRRTQRKRVFLFPRGEAKVVRLGQKKADKPGRREFWSLGVVSSVGPHVRETQKLSDRSLLTRFKAFISVLSIDWFSQSCDSHVVREQRRRRRLIAPCFLEVSLLLSGTDSSS